MTTYILNRSDGGITTMEILDPNTTIEAEIAKWEENNRAAHPGDRMKDVTVVSYSRKQPE